MMPPMDIETTDAAPAASVAQPGRPAVTDASPQVATPAAAASTEPPTRLGDWIRPGLRAGTLRKVTLPAEGPRAHHLLAVILLAAVVEIGLARLEVDGPAEFQFAAWLAPWWTLGALGLLMWVLLER